tara:strand:+ start:376 stop:528 length:153 start_codon:yes stop_codon:yes gene_type:complete
MAMIKTIREWLSVWLFVAVLGVVLIIIALLMPAMALHKMAIGVQEWWYTR